MSEETTASISEVSNSIQEVANVATMDELTQYADNLQEISRKLQGELKNFNLKQNLNKLYILKLKNKKIQKHL